MNQLKGLRLSPRLEMFAVVAILVAVAILLPHTAGSIPLVGLGFAGAIMDAQCVLSDVQALTVGTTVSTNPYDTAAAANNFGAGEPMAFAISVDVTAVVSGGDETYTFEIIESAASALSAPTILAQVAIPRATLVAGYKFAIPFPPHLKSKRWIGAQYVLTGAASAISVSTDIRPMSMLQNDYINANGFTINS